MVRFHNMGDGNPKIQFTAEEETARDLEEANHWKRRLQKVREKRNALIKETDFYALSDITLSDEMRQYRQDLRDVPSGLDNDEKITNLIWPTKP